MKVLGMAGSLRRGSYNRALLYAARELCPPSLNLEVFSLDEVPLYNADLDGGDAPTPVVSLRMAVNQADALLIATPEYNHGIPGVLKNALDWASRPPERSTLRNKPVAVLGASPSMVGSARAQAQLRQVALATLMHVFSYPDVLVSQAHTRFDEEGALVHAETREVVRRMLQAFAEWLEPTS